MSWISILNAVLVCSILSCRGTAIAGDWDFSGFVALSPRIFFDEPAFAGQDDNTISPSAVLQPEFRYEWNQGSDRWTLIPFQGVDADDDRRTHFDLREASWLHIEDSWDLQVGLGKVFWGVTESRHLVDIINQTDRVEDIDEEEKLGQPMINLNWIQDWGSLSFFILPGFRERTFPADDARLRGPLPIAVDDPVFESAAGEKHIDFAVRWKNTIGDWDIGLAHFYGTSREPRFVTALQPDNRAVFIPHYDIIHQTSLDLQFTRDAWLWKLEAITRSGHGERFGAAVAGFEYTLSGVLDSSADLGLLAEYLYDGRPGDAPPTPYNNDIFVGTRLSLNDVHDTSILAGAVWDIEDHATFVTIEAGRRLGDSWKAETELRLFLDVPADDVLAAFRQDSFITLRLLRFF